MDSQSFIRGWGFWELFDENGNLKDEGYFENLVTQVGDQYYGDRAALIPSSAATVTNITNVASPVVTTDAAHGFGVGDVVTLASVTAPTLLNNPWVITDVPSTTTFTISCGQAPGAVTLGSPTATCSVSLPPATGMRLGTGSTAAAKTGAGAAIVTYLSGSTQALDANYPASSLSGSSRRIQYKVTWAAGTATSSSIRECVITTDSQLTDGAGSAASAISRVVFSANIDKQAGDSLAVTWNHDLLGA